MSSIIVAFLPTLRPKLQDLCNVSNTYFHLCFKVVIIFTITLTPYIILYRAFARTYTRILSVLLKIEEPELNRQAERETKILWELQFNTAVTEAVILPRRVGKTPGKQTGFTAGSFQGKRPRDIVGRQIKMRYNNQNQSSTRGFC